MTFDEYQKVQLRMWEAQRAWDALVWQNMQAYPWLFVVMPLDNAYAEWWKYIPLTL